MTTDYCNGRRRDLPIDPGRLPMLCRLVRRGPAHAHIRRLIIVTSERRSTPVMCQKTAQSAVTAECLVNGEREPIDHVNNNTFNNREGVTNIFFHTKRNIEYLLNRSRINIPGQLMILRSLT